MRTTILRFGLAAILAAVAFPAPAATQFEGQDIFVRGAAPPLAVDWAADPSQQLKDDGLNGDVTANDGIYSVNINTSPSPSGSFATTTGPARWKMGAASWNPEYPAGANSFMRRDAVGVVKFVFDTVPKNDGYLPDPNGTTQKGIVYTIPKPVYTTDTVRVVGDFIGELPGGAAWNTSNTAGNMNDAGTGGDAVAGDGIYTLSATGLSAGTKNFKILINPDDQAAPPISGGAWDMTISTLGFAYDAGGNIQFTVFAPADNIKVLFDSAKGRYKITNDNPLANPGPPFFATSVLWGTTLDATTQLYDNATNGDISAGDGVYSRTFTVATGATSSTVQVRQGVGPSYPGTGGYPIGNTTNGQKVLVQFDTNVRADGYTPNTRYVWTDPASRRAAPYVQVVGDFQIDLGAAGNWDNNNAAFQLADAGAAGDVTAGDAIFAATFACPALTSKVFKAVGLANSWDFQFGGAGDGSTYLGNNPGVSFTVPAGTVTFQVDTVTGRINTGAVLPFANPTRNASANADVHDWTMY